MIVDILLDEVEINNFYYDSEKELVNSIPDAVTIVTYVVALRLIGILI